MPIFDQPISAHRVFSTPSNKPPIAIEDGGDDGQEQGGQDATESNTDQPVIPHHFPVAPVIDQLSVPPKHKHKRQRNLKHQHAAVLTAILHRSLLKADFVRAGRAFGLLLRYELNGQRVNLRSHGLWGIGSEILLHRPNPDGAAHDKDMRGSDMPQLPFTERGMRDAKQYFERLMLEFPHRKLTARFLNELQFLPVILGLETYQLQAKAQHIDHVRQAALSNDAARDAMSQPFASPQDWPTSDPYADILDQARAIADRLDEKLLFPPYDRESALFKLKGDLWTWMADLSNDDMVEWREIAATAFRRSERYARS